MANITNRSTELNMDAPAPAVPNSSGGGSSNDGINPFVLDLRRQMTPATAENSERLYDSSGKLYGTIVRDEPRRNVLEKRQPYPTEMRSPRLQQIQSEEGSRRKAHKQAMVDQWKASGSSVEELDMHRFTERMFPPFPITPDDEHSIGSLQPLLHATVVKKMIEIAHETLDIHSNKEMREAVAKMETKDVKIHVLKLNAKHDMPEKLHATLAKDLESKFYTRLSLIVPYSNKELDIASQKPRAQRWMEEQINKGGWCAGG